MGVYLYGRGRIPWWISRFKETAHAVVAGLEHKLIDLRHIGVANRTGMVIIQLRNSELMMS